MIPSLAAILLLGDTIVAALFQTGRFSQSDVQLVWIVLGGYAVGLLAANTGSLYTSAYWALRDTRTPLRFAAVRVTLSALLGWLFAFPLPRAAGIDPRMGVAGLTLAAGISAWVEFGLLRRSMNRRIGKTGVPNGFLVRVSGPQQELPLSPSFQKHGRYRAAVFGISFFDLRRGLSCCRSNVGFLRRSSC